jgi:RNA polymerase sigma-70 factor (ECF subfamily)
MDPQGRGREHPGPPLHQIVNMTRPAVDRSVTDAALLARTAGNDVAAFETLMRRNNGRLFRVARSILKDDSAAEDALQEAYLEAFRHSGTFRGDAQVSTWLTRIVINQSLMRLRKQKRDRVVVPFGASGEDDSQAAEEPADQTAESPAASTLRAELRRLLERRIDELPAAFRAVFVMRDVEEMSVQETADLLGIPPATVRTRLFRARALLREALAHDVDSATVDVFGFAGDRCDRIVAAVLARLP